MVLLRYMCMYGHGLRHRTMHATTLRHLRLSLNSFLDDAALIVRTMDTLRPGGTDVNVGAVEQGSVGWAG